MQFDDLMPEQFAQRANGVVDHDSLYTPSKRRGTAVYPDISKSRDKDFPGDVPGRFPGNKKRPLVAAVFNSRNWQMSYQILTRFSGARYMPSPSFTSNAS